MEDSADGMLRLDGDRRNCEILIIDSIGSVHTAWSEVGLGVVLTLLELRIVLKVLIVWSIFLIWLRIIPFLFGLSDLWLCFLLLDELNSLFLG